MRAAIVALPEEYEWSGHRGLAGLAAPPPWLAVDSTLRCFAPDRDVARTCYKRFVDAGIGLERSPWKDVVAQIYLGSENWIERTREQIESRPRSDEFPVLQRNPVSATMRDVLCAVADTLSVDENQIRFGHGGDARMLAAWLASRRLRLDLPAIAAALRINSTGWVSETMRRCDDRVREDNDWGAVVDRCILNLQRV